MRGPFGTLAQLAAALVTAGALQAQAVGSCPGDRPPGGDLGISRLTCRGPSASCAIFVTDDGGWHHVFQVEPEVSGVTARPDQPLLVDDVLVAVDGRLITTHEGGRYLANLDIGRQVEVLVRRNGRLTALLLTAVSGCGPTSLSVTSRLPSGGRRPPGGSGG